MKATAERRGTGGGGVCTVNTEQLSGRRQSAGVSAAVCGGVLVCAGAIVTCHILSGE